MLRDVAVAAIKRRLGFFTKRDAEIVLEMQDAQVRLEQGVPLPSGGVFMPWFLVSEIATASMIAGEERIALPADFLGEVEEGTLWLFDSSASSDEQWTKLDKDDLDVLIEGLPGEGTPQAYARMGNYFRLKQIPDSATVAAKTLKMFYKMAEPLLDTNIENKWLKYAHELLICEAGERVAWSLRDQGALQLFRDGCERERNKLYHMTELHLHENRRYIMGGED